MATTGHLNSYTLGRGELYFDRYASGLTTTTGERYLGNTPGFSLTVNSEKRDHFSSDSGIRVKDESIVLETSLTGTMSCDNVTPANLALFFFGTASTITQTAVSAGATETIEVEAGHFYQIGVTAGRPTGLRNITVTSVVIVTGSVTAVLGTDFNVDATLGRIEILPGANFPVGIRKDVVVTYSAAQSTFNRVISGSTPIQGAMRLISYNPVGTMLDYYMPKVELTPNGEYNLKGEDWLTMEFSVEVLKKGTLEALYLDGRPI